MSNVHPYVGRAKSRVDGPLKVSGLARYAAEFTAPDLAYAAAVPSAIAKGRITSLDVAAALAAPGVIEVLSHENKLAFPEDDEPFKNDMVAVPGSPFRPFRDDRIHYSGQAIALVVADTHENARHAATLVKATYDAETPNVDVAAASHYQPPEPRDGIPPTPEPRATPPAPSPARRSRCPPTTVWWRNTTIRWSSRRRRWSGSATAVCWSTTRRKAS